MSENLKIQLFPIDKKGHNSFDIIKNDVTGEISFRAGSYMNKNKTRVPQQLVVLLEQQPKKNDWCVTCDDELFYVDEIAHAGLIRDGKGNTSGLDGSRKVIAAYPEITGVLPITVADIQKWVDNGCPDAICVKSQKIIDNDDFITILSLTEGALDIIWEEKKPLPELIQHLADAIDKKGYKVKFGLEQQGHIPTIEAMLKKSGNNERTWQEIGKAIGWCHKTACYWYLDYVLAKQKPVKEEAVTVSPEAVGLHQHLFNYMSEAHNLILTQDEMAGIIGAVEIDAKYQRAQNAYFEL